LFVGIVLLTRKAVGALALARADGALVQPARRLRVRLRRHRSVRVGGDAARLVRSGATRDRRSPVGGRRARGARVPVQSVGLADPRVSGREPRFELAVSRDHRVAATGFSLDRAASPGDSLAAAAAVAAPRSSCARGGAIRTWWRWRQSPARWRSPRGASFRCSR
jgi:hypothetical protein